MRLVAVISASAGAGASAVTGNLAAALARRGKPPLCIDCCPENALRLLFGMAWQDGTGFAPRLLEGRSWNEAAYRSAGGVGFLPFGKLRNEQELKQLLAWLDLHPHWLKDGLRQLQLPADGLVLCDCPRMHAALRKQVLAVADLVLVVMVPDVVSHANAVDVMQMVQRVQRSGAAQTMLLINNFDAACALDHEIAQRLNDEFAPQLLAPMIRRDESLREALACKQTVFEFAPACDAAEDFRALADWLIVRGF